MDFLQILNLTHLFSQFKDNATTVIVSVLVVVIVIPFMKKKCKQIEGMFTFLQAEMEESKKERERRASTEEKEKDKTELLSQIRSTQKISKFLRSILDEFEADRISIFRYHNGGRDLIGIPFTRVTNTHEEARLGVSPQIQNFQGLPVSVFSYLNNFIMQKRFVPIENVKDISDMDHTTYSMLLSQDIKSMYVVGLFAMDHVTPIGFIALDFVRHTRALDKDERIKVLQRAETLCGMLYAGAGAQDGQIECVL